MTACLLLGPTQIHMPATDIPLEETLAEINECHVAGKIEEFGLSNFPAWQVVEVCQYCKRKGYVLPTVYQGEGAPCNSFLTAVCCADPKIQGSTTP